MARCSVQEFIHSAGEQERGGGLPELERERLQQMEFRGDRFAVIPP